MPHLKPVGHQSWKGPRGVVLSSNHDYGNTQRNGRTEISQKGERKTWLLAALGMSWARGFWEVGGHSEATRLTCDARLARHGSKSKHPVCLCGPTSVCATLGFSDILECNPESTNWMVRLVLIVATAAFTSFGTTSPPGQSIRSLTRGCCGCSSPGTRAVHHAAGHVLAVPRIAPGLLFSCSCNNLSLAEAGVGSNVSGPEGRPIKGVAWK